METNEPEDPRAKSNRYSKGLRAKFDQNSFDFATTQFLIDDNYVGEPPQVQVSIDNLNDNIDENFLKRDLSKIGKIRSLEIIRHPRTFQHLGLAKVQFEYVSNADACIANFNGKQMMGRQLSVFRDVRFTIIERLKEAKLNPRPIHPTQQPKPGPAQLQLPPPLALPPVIATPVLTGGPLHQPTITATLHHAHHSLHKSNPSIPPLTPATSLDYSLTTPNSISSSNATPEPSSRQRLEDRIATLMKQSNNVLDPIVPSVAQPTLPGYNTLGSRESSSSASYYQSQNKQPPIRMSDKLAPHINSRSSDSNGYRRQEPLSNYNNHYSGGKQDPYKSSRYSRHDEKSSRYDDPNSSDSYKSARKSEESAEIILTEKQIHCEVLPFCYDRFLTELTRNLASTLLKKLRETYGYQTLEKAQAAYREKQQRLKLARDMERIKQEEEKQLSRIYLSRERVSRLTEAPRPRANVVRQRTDDDSMMPEVRRGQVDMRRVNRSSAYVAEPERRGSHNTSIDSDSDMETSSTSSSASSSRSASPSSYSSISTSSSGSLSLSGSSGSSASSFDIKPQVKANKEEERRPKSKDAEVAIKTPELLKDSRSNDLELSAAEGLLQLCSASVNDARKDPSMQDENDIDSVKSLKSSPKKKRRKQTTREIIGVASEYRAAKRFASDPNHSSIYDELAENAMYDDENLIEEKPEVRQTFAQRPQELRDLMLDDLSILEEEDLKYLEPVHKDLRDSISSDFEIPFGSENANKAHLNVKRKHVIDKPKWWTGCSRCDVIHISEKEKANTLDETNYEDLTKAPIKSHVIQAVNQSSRRENKSDQRRIATLNPDMAIEYLKEVRLNTLQTRAKNLRFSRSKIHKWGLFACENIASGDAVIEYVGEKIRPSVADHREKYIYTNLPTHDGSSYFFRVDVDVIDATLKGNKARFINHSCNPNCIAKVIRDEWGNNSIVIYAKQQIQQDEEITYDYKFPIEDKKIPCNCRAPNCHKYLN